MLVTPRYMIGTAKRGWAVGVLFFVAFLLLFTVQAMMELSGLRDTINYHLNTSEHLSRAWIVSQLSDYVRMLRATFVLLSGISAVFAGGYFMSFMHNKVSAGFYHSLPERRSGHFISAIFGAVVTYLAAALTNYILVFFIFIVNGFLYTEITTALLSIFWYGIFYFAVVLSISVLAGAVSGNSAIHTLLTLFLIFFLPALYLSCMALMASFGSAFRYLSARSLMFDIEIYKWLSPFFRAIYILLYADEDMIATPEFVIILVDILMTALTFALAYIAYKKRPIERSGTPIIYGWLSETVKYIIMAPSAVFLAFIFDELSGGIWTFIGYLAGLVIAFMLCNTILNRSAKAMFSNAKGLLIYTVAFSVFAGILLSGFWRLPDYAVPNSDKITLYLSGWELTFTDKDEISLLRRAMKDTVNNLRESEEAGYTVYQSSHYYDYFYDDGRYVDASDEEYEKYFERAAEDMTRSIGLSVNYKTFTGAQLRYYYSNINYSDASPLLSALLQCDSFIDMISPKLDGDLYFLNMSLDLVSSTSHIANTNKDALINTAGLGSLRDKIMEINSSLESDFLYTPKDKVKKMLSDSLSPGSIDYFQRQAVGKIGLGYKTGTNSYYDFSQTLYYGDLQRLSGDVRKIFGNEGFKFGYNYYEESRYIDFGAIELDALTSVSFEKYCDYMSDSIEEIKVYNKKTDQIKVFSRSQIREIFPYLAAIREYYISPLTRTDSDYVVLLKVKNTKETYKYYDYIDHIFIDGEEYYVDEYGNMHTADEDVEIIDTHEYYITWFLEGQVPGFIG